MNVRGTNVLVFWKLGNICLISFFERYGLIGTKQCFVDLPKYWYIMGVILYTVIQYT